MCPHCSQNLSYSAFTAHKARYFDAVSLKWTTDDNLGLSAAGFTARDIDSTPELNTQDLGNRDDDESQDSLCEEMEQEPSSPSMSDTQHSHGEDDESQDVNYDTLSLSDQSSEGCGDQDREALEVCIKE